MPKALQLEEERNMSRERLISPRVLVPAIVLMLAIIACGSSTPVQSTPDPNVSPTPAIERYLTTDLQEFLDVLTQALADRDFDTFPTLMRDPFELQVFRAGGSLRSPPTATSQIERSLYPPEGTEIECGGVPLDDALRALGITMDEYEAQAPGVLYCTGWGPDGVGEAILLVNYDDQNFLYWTHITAALNGFVGASR